MSLLRVVPGLMIMVCLAAAAPISSGSNVPPPSPDLMSVKNVYILPMRSGFDQYLANELTSRGVVRVVTDPQRADAVLTDHLGESFQERMDDLFPPPPKPMAKVEVKSGDAKSGDAKSGDAKSGDAKSGDAKSGDDKSGDVKDESASSDEPIVDTRPISGAISSGKGNIFLVGREGRAVLWSDFHNPRSRQPNDMKHTADAVASDLKHALQPPDSGSK